MQSQNQNKDNKKIMIAWAFYDWANSVYPLVISSAIFPIYYAGIFKAQNTDTIRFFGIDFKTTALISIVTSVAFIVVAFLSPLLSGIADFIGNKKRFMQFFCYLGALSCVGLSFFTTQNIGFGISCYFFGLIGFWGSLVFYNSYLPDIASEELQDKLSAKGFSLGYIGSVLLLLINLFFILGKEGEQALELMKYSFISVGVWWILFSQYTFYYLPIGAKKEQKLSTKIVFNGFSELKKVWNLLRQNVRLKRYLIAFFVFSMGVQTVMLIATYFGEEEVSWSSNEESTKGLIISILLIQLVAVLGAYLTSKASKKYGNIPVLIFIVVCWIFICSLSYFIVYPIDFYITAACVGLVMGGVQSLSRSTYSKFLPETDDTASFFSFYDVAEKIGIVIGMTLYGIIDQLTGSMRYPLVFLSLFFIIGTVLLLRVPKNQKL
jgi:MFS transporter, UMF1 family